MQNPAKPSLSSLDILLDRYYPLANTQEAGAVPAAEPVPPAALVYTGGDEGVAAAENGVIVFSASTGKQESIESKSWGNGAFTKALIAGLTGGADFRKDGVVTHQGLSYFLGQEVKTLTKGRQTPVTAVPMGMVDFPLVAFSAR
mgnify:CR=1 FL=1